MFLCFSGCCHYSFNGYSYTCKICFLGKKPSHPHIYMSVRKGPSTDVWTEVLLMLQKCLFSVVYRTPSLMHCSLGNTVFFWDIRCSWTYAVLLHFLIFDWICVIPINILFFYDVPLSLFRKLLDILSLSLVSSIFFYHNCGLHCFLELNHYFLFYPLLSE